MTLKIYPLIEYWYITQNIHCMQEIILKVRYFERELSKSLKKVNFIFSFEPSPFLLDKIIKNKRSLELVTSCSSGYKIPLLVICYLTKFDGVI